MKQSNWEEKVSELLDDEFDLNHLSCPPDCSNRDAQIQQIENIKDFIKDNFVAKEEVEKIDSFDLVEPCEPDCTPERHAYHEGTWSAHLKLEKILQDLLKRK